MDLPLLMAAASGLAIGNCIFFGVYLCRSAENNRLSNYLLAFLLFALAIRISKSVIIILFPNSSDIFPAIGLIGMAAIGPFLYLYLQSIHHENYLFSARKWLHFLPSFALLIALPMPFINEMVIYRFYQFVVAQILVYLLLSFQIHYAMTGENSDPLLNKWGYILIGGTGLIWIAFFIQLIIDTFLLYLIATTIAAFVLYGVGFWMMRHQPVVKRSVNRLKSFNGNAEEIYTAIRNAFERDKLYRDHDLTIDKLAEEIKVQSYLLSIVINEKFKKSFPELINYYRVKEAQKLLGSEAGNHLSVESIAYDSGFNSISSFYNAFKKNCGITPGEYRKQNQMQT